MINGLLLWRALRRIGAYQPELGWNLFATRVVIASLFMGGAVFGLSAVIGDWLTRSAMDRVWGVAACVAVGIGAYVAVLYVAGFRIAHIRRPEQG